MTNLKRLKCRLCGWSTLAEMDLDGVIRPDEGALWRMKDHWAQKHWDDLMIVEAKEEEYYRGREVAG